MNPTSQAELTADDDPRLLRAAQEYLAELEAGRPPARAAFPPRSPDRADSLAVSLAALDAVHGAAPLLHPAPPPAPKEEVPAEPLGDFHLMSEIGRGGMGVVYEAVQR